MRLGSMSTNGVTVDATYFDGFSTHYQANKSKPRHSTPDPRTYLHELFSVGTPTIRQRDIKVRSARLIDEIATKYGYKKQFVKGACVNYINREE